VEHTGNRWNDGFIPSLEVSTVRIFKGTYRLSDELLMDAIGKPRPWKLENLVTVVPKRIEIDTEPAEFNYDCRGDANSADGDYVMQRCRYKDSNDENKVRRLRTTPRVGLYDTATGVQRAEPLIWTVKFGSSSGFVTPELAQGERLAIEFTLKVH
jgi:hypothetical protein